MQCQARKGKEGFDQCKRQSSICEQAHNRAHNGDLEYVYLCTQHSKVLDRNGEIGIVVAPWEVDYHAKDER